ncbi:DNA-binding transcriptional ArsR family regulator [Paenibacillus phyllosphaerae]|uniref:DNA-binding transcriptional ArsR family regulator n=1 Tax=Paenibacillus phyllosphaerae TaxID=274593 RepID=A0A7W5FNP7_9BACL|nr:autorepressor SdpR family transcription factor [Paenibacillus phyllosphaerae]MBB3111357.1 DNA-binding transcriptional ArsR family regulator [Paenibacillus phyllosphaerae]
MVNTVFKALSDPTRRTILDLLREQDMTAGDIADHFDISKPSISQHLTLLKQADLVSSKRDGQHIVYSLNLTVFNELLKWILQFQSSKGSEPQ